MNEDTEVKMLTIEHLDFDLTCEKRGEVCGIKAEWRFRGVLICCGKCFDKLYCDMHHNFFLAVAQASWQCDDCSSLTTGRHWNGFTKYEWSRL